MSTDTDTPAIPAPGIADVRRVPLGRLAQSGTDAGMGRVLAAMRDLRIAACAFQSSI